MGRSRVPGIYQDGEGRWCVDKWYKGERLRNRLETAEEAKAWLFSRLDQLRRVKVWGERPRHLFDQAAARYLDEYAQLVSIHDTGQMLAGVMPYIGHLHLDQVHDGPLRPFVVARLKAGRAPKTINLGLSAVRRVLNLAARKWRDENGRTWLEAAPLITLLPLVGQQREPRPINLGRAASVATTAARSSGADGPLRSADWRTRRRCVRSAMGVGNPGARIGALRV